MNQSINKTYLLFMAVFKVAMISQAFPLGTNTTIDNPCGRDLSSVGSRTYLPMIQEIQLSLGAFQNLLRQADRAMTEYKIRNVLTEVEVRNLTSPLSNLEGLPSRQSSDYSELVPQLRQDFRDISIFLVYLQHFQVQQLAYDGNLLETHLRNLNQALYSVLCRTDILLRQQKATPNHFVDSSVIPSELQNIRESKNRYFRDFILIKDTKAYIEIMSGDYEDLFNHLSRKG